MGFINVPLIPVKLLMFLSHGGISALLPFLGIHMKSLGITVTETAFILTILPFLSAVGPPIGGALADKLGNYKIVYIVATLLSVALHTLMYWVVPACINPYDPSMQILSVNNTLKLTNIDCLSTGQLSIRGSICSANYSLGTHNDVNISSCYSSCIDVCSESAVQSLSYCWNSFERQCQRMSQASDHSIVDTLCTVQCDVQPGAVWTCVPDTWRNESVTGDRVTTLASYSTLRVTSTTVMWLAVPLLDSAAVVMSKEHNAQLGPQKMFSQLGFCLLPPLSSFLVDWATKKNGFEDYGPAFYIFAIMHLLSIVVIFFLRMGARLPAQNLAANIGKVLRDRRVSAMASVVFLNGCGFGVTTGFLFWYMEEVLASPKFVMGLTQTVAGLFGFPAMFFAAPIIRVLGHSRIFALGLAAYSLRFLGLSFVPAGQAYWLLALQPLEAISHSLVIVVATDYGGQLSPKYVASLQGIIFAAHYCFGKGTGTLFTGLLRNVLEWRQTFQVLAIVFAALTVFYLFLDYFFIYRHRLQMKLLDARESQREAEEAERQKQLLSGNVSAISEVQAPIIVTPDDFDDDRDSSKRIFKGNRSKGKRDLKKNDL